MHSIIYIYIDINELRLDKMFLSSNDYNDEDEVHSDI